MSDINFPCHSCGACCMVVGHILEDEANVNQEYLGLVREFPFKANENGWCEKLGEDLKCTVYEDRPLLCRIKETWHKLFKNKMSQEAYYADTTKSCKVLMKSELGMNDEEIKKVYDEITSTTLLVDLH